MTSVSSGGASVITLQFDLSLSLDVAEQEVQAAINAANTLLPQSLPAPPVYAKVNPADAPVLTLAVTSNAMPLPQVGRPRRNAHRPEDLAAFRRGSRQHQRRTASRHPHPGQSAGAGRLRPQHRRSAHDHRQRQLRMRRKAASTAPRAPTPSTPTTRSQNADDYKNIIVAYKNGEPVRLSDVAIGRVRARKTPSSRAG